MWVCAPSQCDRWSECVSVFVAVTCVCVCNCAEMRVCENWLVGLRDSSQQQEDEGATEGEVMEAEERGRVESAT